MADLEELGPEQSQNLAAIPALMADPEELGPEQSQNLAAIPALAALLAY
jgi:hypothetical protein